MHGSAHDSLTARGGLPRRRPRPEVTWFLSVALRLATLLMITILVAELLERMPGAMATAPFDAAIIRALAEHRVGWLTASFQMITGLGGEGFLVVVVLAAGLILRRQTNSWRPLFVLLAVAIGAVVLERVIKLVVARPRPPAAWMVIQEKGCAFPSGHAIRSATVYGGLAYLATRINALGRRIHVALWMLAAGLSFLVGVSRVYLGVHWPTDVIGGWILAIAWLWLALSGPPL